MVKRPALYNGVSELTIERLCSQAAVSRSTFYVYFEDKGDLLRAWFSDITVELAATDGVDVLLAGLSVFVAVGNATLFDE